MEKLNVPLVTFLFLLLLSGCQAGLKTNLITAPPAQPPQSSKTQLELFVMSKCPFGVEAEKALIPVREQFHDQVDLRIFFIAQPAYIAQPTSQTSTTKSNAPSTETNPPHISQKDVKEHENPSLNSSPFPKEMQGEPATSPAPPPPPAPASHEEDQCQGEPQPDGGKFISLHGQPEVEEDIRQVVIMKYYPEKFWDYLLYRAENYDTNNWEEAAARAWINIDHVRQISQSAEGEKLFEKNIRRSQDFKIPASPTLLVNNQRYSGPINHDSLSRAICSGTSWLQYCRDVPICGRDQDCLASGKVGICLNPDTSKARCQFADPVKISLRVIEMPHASMHQAPMQQSATQQTTTQQTNMQQSTTPQATTLQATTPQATMPQSAGREIDQKINQETDQMIEISSQLFPRIEVEKIAFDSPLASELIQKYQIAALPAFLYTKDMDQDLRYIRLKDNLMLKEDSYLLNPQFFSSLYLPNREEKRGQVDLFIEGLSEHDNQILQQVQEIPQLKNSLSAVHFLAKAEKTEQEAAPNPMLSMQNDPNQPNVMILSPPVPLITFKSRKGLPEIKEDIRQLCITHDTHVAHDTSQKYWDYLACRSEQITGRKNNQKNNQQNNQQNNQNDNQSKAGQLEAGQPVADQPEADWKTCSQEAGLEMLAIEACSLNEQGAQLLLDDIALAEELNIHSSPVFLINNKWLIKGGNLDIVKEFISQINTIATGLNLP